MSYTVEINKDPKYIVQEFIRSKWVPLSYCYADRVSAIDYMMLVINRDRLLRMVTNQSKEIVYNQDLHKSRD